MGEPAHATLVSPPDTPVTASVCLCTRHRPHGLRGLVHALSAQQAAPPFEVIVVDNDCRGSARAVLESFAPSLSLRYEIEPERSLAAARNRSVRLARGAFLAFVDDDEVVPSTWLSSLHETILGTGASAVFGPVEVEFGEHVPDEIRRCRLLAYPHFPEGSLIPWFYTRTSNAYLRREALPDPRAPFPRAFGRTGGEDIAMFKRIADAGGVFAAAGTAACVKEFREPARANLRWALRRSLRNGGNLADLQWAELPRHQRLRLALQSLRKASRHAWDAARNRSRNRLDRLERWIDAAECAGRGLSVLGYRCEEYGSRG